MKINKAFTLLEIIVAIIITGILATISITYFNPSRERVMDREAVANLQIIQNAQKTFRMDMGVYFSGADTTAVNNGLRLSLPSGANQNWNYQVWNDGCAQATRNGSNLRTWRIRITEDMPQEGVTCP